MKAGAQDNQRTLHFSVLSPKSKCLSISLAVSLILLRFAPIAGLIFLWISISIAIATIAGRYHYTLDVITAAILVTILFLIQAT